MQPQSPVAPMPPIMPPQPVPPVAPVLPPQPLQPAPIQPQLQQPTMQLDPAYAHTGLATASLVLGIVSLPASILNLLSLPIPVTAIVLGIISLKRKKNFALAGIILGVIGIILSGVVLYFGNKAVNDKKAGGKTTTNSAVAANGDQVVTNCYNFKLPPGLSKDDVSQNTDCKILSVNASSTEDLGVAPAPVKTTVTDANRKPILKAVIDEFKKELGSSINITSSKYITVDGQTAYEATGTEQRGNYKYITVLAMFSPGEYQSPTGKKWKAFIMINDSATSQETVDKVAASWHWQ